jgi:hypothetical protein
LTASNKRKSATIHLFNSWSASREEETQMAL